MTVEVRTLGRDCKVYEDIVFSNLQKDREKTSNINLALNFKMTLEVFQKKNFNPYTKPTSQQ